MQHLLNSARLTIIDRQGDHLVDSNWLLGLLKRKVIVESTKPRRLGERLLLGIVGRQGVPCQVLRIWRLLHSVISCVFVFSNSFFLLNSFTH